MFNRSILTASLAFLAAPAFAGGFAPTVDTAPPPAPVVVTPAPVMAPARGDWTGFSVGGSLSYGSLSSGDVTPDDLLDGDGTLTGLHAGYDYQFGRIVVGAELENEWSQISLDNADVDLDRVERAKLRLGYDAGRILPYVTGGYAHAYVSSGDVDDDFEGRFAGIGAEYRLTERFTTGVEVLRHEFEDVTPDVNLDATTVSLRGTFRF